MSNIYRYLIYSFALFAVFLLSQETVNAQARVCTNWGIPEPNCNAQAPANCRSQFVGYRYHTWQDCCGARALCAQVNFISGYNPDAVDSSENVCGSGCVANEMSGGQCGTAEHQTSWYVFEVRPLVDENGDLLAGASNLPGAPAGTLRFKIIPCDIEPNNGNCSGSVTAEPCDCNNISIENTIEDDGETGGTGNTDYDWALYNVTSFRQNKAASCAAIKSSANVGGANSVKVSCNYSGARGATGVFEPGDIDENNAGGPRYNKPFKVFVGDRFVLAVDNFSTNLRGCQVDFTGRGWHNWRNEPEFSVQDSSANVTLPSETLKFNSIEAAPTCSTGTIKFKFNRPVYYDAVKKDQFSIVKKGNNVTPDNPKTIIDKIVPADPALITTIGYTDEYLAYVSYLHPTDPNDASSMYLLKQVKKVIDICPAENILDSIPFYVEKMIVPQSYAKVICEDSALNLSAIVSAQYRKEYRNDSSERALSYEWRSYYYTGTGANRRTVFQTIRPNQTESKNPQTDSVQLNFEHPGVLVSGDLKKDSVLRFKAVRLDADSIFRFRAYVRGNDTLGDCKDSTDFIIKVHANPVVLPDTGKFWCYGHPITITASSPDTTGPYLFFWKSKNHPDETLFRTRDISFIADTTDSLRLYVVDTSDTTRCDTYSKWNYARVSIPRLKSVSDTTIAVCTGSTVRLTPQAIYARNYKNLDQRSKLRYEWKFYKRSANGGRSYVNIVKDNDQVLSDPTNRLRKVLVTHVAGDTLQDSVLTVVPKEFKADSTLNFRLYVWTSTDPKTNTCSTCPDLICKDSIDFHINVRPLPDIVTDTATTWCYGDPVTIHAFAPVGPQYKFSWESKNYGAGAELYSTRNATFVADSTDSLRLTVTDMHDTTYCESKTKWIKVSVSKPVITQFLMDTAKWGSASFPATVTFRNTSYMQYAGGSPRPVPYDTANYKFVWTFGDGAPISDNSSRTDTVTYDTTQHVSHTFRESFTGSDNHTYIVNLRFLDPVGQATDAERCTPSQSQTLLLRSSAFPNVITPGGDGHNDNLAFYGVSRDITLKVYNRWGHEVYSKHPYDNTWNGDDLPNGVYYYVLEDNLAPQNNKTSWIKVVK
ncbi:MAG: gliding motility-associated C-terminal domain-containing protein [Bacteroidota bacterium]